MISIVAPIYRDVPCFLRLREEITAIFRHSSLSSASLRFVAIDDSGNQDPEIKRFVGLTDVKTIACPYNMGHQGALVFGLRSLMKELKDDDVIVTLDSDGQDKPADVLKLVEELNRLPHKETIVLAQRTRRKESLGFSVLYFFFKAFFRFLTGTHIKTGNFAAYHARTLRAAVFHSYFDLCYSSTLHNLKIPVHLVDCERSERFFGESRMNFIRLVVHGLRMLTPFSERITVRLLFFFVAYFALSLLLLVGLAVSYIFALASPAVLSLLAMAFALVVGAGVIAGMIVLLVLFFQSQAIGLTALSRINHPSDG